MKKLPLKSPAYRYVERSFKEWLDVLGYASNTMQALPVHIREYLHYMEQEGNSQLQDITKENIRAYFYKHLKNRSNQRYGGGLSSAHLNKHLQALYKFCDYLRQSGKLIVAPLGIRREEKNQDTPAVLTESEIKELYKACDMFPTDLQSNKGSWFYPAMALRDKAMLAIYYGCGLRSNEGVHLDLNDIFWDKEIVHVRKGKGNKERFVPVSKSGLKHLERYVYDSRPLFLRNEKIESLFINERGKPMGGNLMLLRLDILVERTENQLMLEKEPGIHTLRHSIATHLHGNGMKLERVKDFLGHSSLESTQIYTHLVEQEI